MQKTTHEIRESRLFGFSLQALLVLAFVTGGSAQISGWDDTVLQLLALPVIAWASWRIGRLPASTMRNLGLVVAALVALVPLLQLLPIPEAIWRLPDARQRLAADLAAVGANTEFRWSLAPLATERAFVFLLPPLAAFVATLAVEPERHWSLLRTIMLLAMASLLLAFVQLGVPAESPLNPFPRWAHLMNGIFANQNHQAISLVVAIVIALAAMLGALRHVGEGRRQAWTPWVFGFLALFAGCALPLMTSRGAVLIAVLAVGLVPVAMGVFTGRRLRASVPARIGLAACIALVLIGAWGAIGWIQADVVDELRAPLRAATLELGRQHAPLGAGMGAFVAAFEQGAPDALLLPTYINHAHNDWLQWWMEAGWMGVAVLALALAVFATASIRALRHGGRDRWLAVAAMLGVVALMLHSWVDYPLRTVSLATVAATMVAIVVSRGMAGDLRIARPPGS